MQARRSILVFLWWEEGGRKEGVEKNKQKNKQWPTTDGLGSHRGQSFSPAESHWRGVSRRGPGDLCCPRSIIVVAMEIMLWRGQVWRQETLSPNILF